jgi:hypothetical protein
MVEEHKLRCSEVGFTFNSELVGIMRNLGPFDLLHDDVTE